jgi:hypothetical protein
MFVENIKFTRATCIKKDCFLFGEKKKEQRMVKKWHVCVKDKDLFIWDKRYEIVVVLSHHILFHIFCSQF